MSKKWISLFHGPKLGNWPRVRCGSRHTDIITSPGSRFSPVWHPRVATNCGTENPTLFCEDDLLVLYRSGNPRLARESKGVGALGGRISKNVFQVTTGAKRSVDSGRWGVDGSIERWKCWGKGEVGHVSLFPCCVT